MISNGDLVWVKSFGGSNDTSSHSVIPAADGGFVATGNSRSSNLDMNGLHSTSNTEPIAIAVKYDTNGNIQWKKSLEGTNQTTFMPLRQRRTVVSFRDL